MESKPWYLSKGMWAGVIAVLFAAWDQVGISFPTLHLPIIPEYIFAILAALGLYARKTATTVIR